MAFVKKVRSRVEADECVYIVDTHLEAEEEIIFVGSGYEKFVYIQGYPSSDAKPVVVAKGYGSGNHELPLARQKREQTRKPSEILGLKGWGAIQVDLLHEQGVGVPTKPARRRKRTRGSGTNQSSSENRKRVSDSTSSSSHNSQFGIKLLLLISTLIIAFFIAVVSGIDSGSDLFLKWEGALVLSVTLFFLYVIVDSEPRKSARALLLCVLFVFLASTAVKIIKSIWMAIGLWILAPTLFILLALVAAIGWLIISAKEVKEAQREEDRKRKDAYLRNRIAREERARKMKARRDDARWRHLNSFFKD